MRYTFAVAATLLAFAAVPAVAHHPFAAEYDWKKPVTITGAVTSFTWGNPHSMLELKGKSDDGTEAAWKVELGSGNRLSQAGWTKTDVRAGDQISVDGWLARDGSKQVSAKSVTIKGKEMHAAGAFFEMPQTPRPTGTTGKSPGK